MREFISVSCVYPPGVFEGVITVSPSPSSRALRAGGEVCSWLLQPKARGPSGRGRSSRRCPAQPWRGGRRCPAFRERVLPSSATAGAAPRGGDSRAALRPWLPVRQSGQSADAQLRSGGLRGGTAPCVRPVTGGSSGRPSPSAARPPKRPLGVICNGGNWRFVLGVSRAAAARLGHGKACAGLARSALPFRSCWEAAAGRGSVCVRGAEPQGSFICVCVSVAECWFSGGLGLRAAGRFGRFELLVDWCRCDARVFCTT